MQDVDIQVVVNLIVVNGDSQVLYLKRDPKLEKWWLPGEDVEPFTHPDAQATKIAASIGLTHDPIQYRRLQSFRGRRGWHLMFDYLVEANGSVSEPYRWFDIGSPPTSMHGEWERSVVHAVLNPAK